MAARKKASRRKPAASPPRVRLWPAKLGIVSLRLYVGVLFLDAMQYKLLEHGLPLGDAIERFVDGDPQRGTGYVPLIERCIADPPVIFGWRLQWYADFLEAVMLPESVRYVFGAAILLFEVLLGFALVLGVGTRLMAFLGALLMLVFGLTKGHYVFTVTEGLNWLLAAALLTLGLVAAGRIWGLDAWLKRWLPGWIS